MTVEYSEVFIPSQDAALIAAWVTRFAIVGSSIADYISLSIDSSVGSLHNDFGASIAIEVVNHELGIVGACTNIMPHVDTP